MESRSTTPFAIAGHTALDIAELAGVRALHTNDVFNSVYLFDNDNVAKVFQHPGLWSERPEDERAASLPEHVRPIESELRKHLSKWPVFSERQYHSWVRKLLVRGLRSPNAHLETAVDALLSDLTGAEDSDFDWLNGVAIPAAVASIATVVGVEQSEASYLAHKAPAILAEISALETDHRKASTALRSVRDLHEWLYPHIHRSPSPFLRTISDIWTDDRGGASAATAVLAQVVTGAFDPLVSTLCVVAELASPDVLLTMTNSEVREEIIRIAAPIRYAPRYARCPVQIDGVNLPAGSRVVPVIAAANLDPHRYTEPLRMQPRPPGHWSFGAGSHYCLGANMTRVVVDRVVEHLRSEELTFQPRQVELFPEFGILRYKRYQGKLSRFSYRT